VAAGWYPDPLDPTRRRAWDGAHWDARVSTDARPTVAPAAAAISWTPGLAATPSPTPAPAAGPEQRARSRTRRPLALVGIAAAALLIAGVAVAGAELVDAGQQRPHVVPEQAYRDPRAGFALRYPDGWRVLRRDRGDGIRLAIGATDAPSTETNTVSVVTGSESAPLPPLHTLADQLTEALRDQLPGVRLEAAERTRLADAPAFHFTFRDPEATPPTRIQQYVGRTTSGRPLTVTATVREPRTAPNGAELDRFVQSLAPS
jgi:hypothetical protein